MRCHHDGPGGDRAARVRPDAAGRPASTDTARVPSWMRTPARSRARGQPVEELHRVELRLVGEAHRRGDREGQIRLLDQRGRQPGPPRRLHLRLDLAPLGIRLRCRSGSACAAGRSPRPARRPPRTPARCRAGSPARIRGRRPRRGSARASRRSGRAASSASRSYSRWPRRPRSGPRARPRRARSASELQRGAETGDPAAHHADVGVQVLSASGGPRGDRSDRVEPERGKRGHAAPRCPARRLPQTNRPGISAPVPVLGHRGAAVAGRAACCAGCGSARTACHDARWSRSASRRRSTVATARAPAPN